MDPLSDILALLKPRNYMVRGFDVAGPWAVHIGAHEGIKVYALVAGEGWLSVDGVADPVHMRAGDCLLLPRGRAFTLGTDLSSEPLSMETVAARGQDGAVSVVNGGGECFGIGGWFSFAGHHANILLGVLPPIVHIRGDADRAALRWSLDQMMQEMREPRPGGHLVAQHLAHLILVQALRLHLDETGADGGVGWLFALADPQMSAAINAIHADPARRWTLADLAGKAAMSRSSFAEKFKRTVGSSPMEYLTRWRMLLAGERLEHSSDPVSAIALSLGYESESAFSTAFKRVMASSPRRYARGGAMSASRHAMAGAS
jgi:AraC-like DNA-binding protein/mannose-6-phosphate isomerase-like protein (cupin superfamily)